MGNDEPKKFQISDSSSVTALDIIIPVYNEGENIIPVLASLSQSVKTPFRVMICYDHDEDTTLPVLKNYQPSNFKIALVKNRARGAHEAIMTGFEQSDARAVLVLPADDIYNAPLIDRMYDQFSQGCDLVVASRLMKGGCMKGGPWLKSFLVRAASFTLYGFARIPVTDASNGFRLFSRRVVDGISIESKRGFAFSLELLVKCHRLGWRMGEVPASWFERTKGKSRFRLFEWLPQYLRWYFYGFATTYFGRSSRTVAPKIGEAKS